MAETELELETLEVQLLLEGIYQRWGYDFRQYALSSLRRRIRMIVERRRLGSVSALQEQVLRDPQALDELLLALSVHATAMFRDPPFFAALRSLVIPRLRTYPFIRIWCAGCSTAEEVYSLAIVLEEEGIYDRCRVYATDFNEAVIRTAKAGVFPLEVMKEYPTNYQAAGGRHAFSSYYTAAYDHVLVDPKLRRNVLFAQHNLAIDASFNEFQLLLCRNVMIYFNRDLQARVHDLLYESLPIYGFLALGNRESLHMTPHEHDYEPCDERNKIYRRIR